MPATSATLLLARSPALPDTAAGAASIQIFPPGDLAATVTNAQGEPVDVQLHIDAAAAETLEAARAGYEARAAAGQGDAPYFDFNHEDREASAWPKKIFWAGDHPIQGGIRAAVEWSAAGEAAVAGKTFRRFSPAFHADLETGRLTGAPVNMGGLVNRAALRTIAPLFAREATKPETPETNEKASTMNETDTAALSAELASLKEENQKLRDELAAIRKTEAETLVAAAAKDGRIPAAPEFQAKWVQSLMADPAARELLAGLPAAQPAKTEFRAKEPDAPAEESGEALLAKFRDLPREEKEEFFARHSDAIVAAREAALHG